MRKNRLTFSICILAVGFFISSFNLHAQVPNWAWAKTAQGISSSLDDNEGWSVATDPFGNVYAAGVFTSSYMVFDTDTLFNSGGLGISDMFLVKYDTNGNELWSRSSNGSGSNGAVAVATDSIGNVFVSGIYTGIINFGTDTFPFPMNSDIFIAKFAGNGNLLWANHAGGALNDNARSICTDLYGSVCLAGEFTSPTIIFGTTTLTNTSVATTDVFITKYDSTGNVIWAKSRNYDGVSGITCDIYNNFFFTGASSGAVIPICLLVTPANGLLDEYVGKIDNNGNCIGATILGGSDDDGGTSIVTDFNGNVFVAGYFLSNTIAFNVLSTVTNSSPGYFDLLLIKLNNSLTEQWRTGAGSSGWDEAHGIAVDPLGNIYMSGLFIANTITFGSSTLTNATSFTSEIFVAKFDPSGIPIWGKRFGGGFPDYPHSMTQDTYGNVYITGFFESTMIVADSNTIWNTQGGYPSFFIAKLGSNTVGINSNEINFKKLEIFPNPSSGKFSFKILSDEFEIYNILGERIPYIKTTEGNNSTIDISCQPAGIYFLKINSGEQFFSEKIILQN